MTLPRWLEPLPEAQAMREADRWAVEERGIPSIDLMERAGEALARVTAEVCPDGRIAVVCGAGNNGGDGLVAARHLRDWGHDVDVLITASEEDYRGDAAENLGRLPGSEPRRFEPGALEGAGGVVDALLGTGFSDEPRDPAKSAIDAINGANARVVAADVPSGVDASTGEVAGAAVRADATVTFHAAKPGLWIAPGKTHAGQVQVIDIGIPPDAPMAGQIGLIRFEVLAEVPRRHAGSTKFTEGAVVVAGGSRGLTGAPCLAAEAAARAGAGYVTACVPASVDLVFELRLLEAMTVPLPDEDGALTEDGVQKALESAERAQALVLGPGLSRSEGAAGFARELARRAKLPLLLDADGLNAHAGRLGDLSERPGPTVLTPHAGELGRLLDLDSAAIEERRLEHARRAAAESGAIVVLKGDDTLVAEPDGRVGVSPGGGGALATAGTGDVLSGVIGAFLAKGLEPFDAACAGVALHARAGKLAAEARPAESVIARDVIEALPPARVSGADDPR